ncbi:MAG: ATP-binding protein [Kineosporiaceae bacterium]
MAYLTRQVDHYLDRLLPAAPAVFVTGPRAVGKTTTALRRTTATARLDVPAEAAVWRTDPDALLANSPTPLLLDEWQVVPDVMGAVKRAVDADPTPGRYVITGSAGSDRSPATWPGTGRLLAVPMRVLTRREIEDRTSEKSPVERLLDPTALAAGRSGWTIVDYVRDAVAGGFPAVTTAPDVVRRPWLRTYVDQLVARDVPALGGSDDPDRARRFLAAWAAASGTVMNDQTLYEVGGVGRDAAASLTRRLRDVGVVDTLPAWWTNHVKRLTKSPKRFVTDGGLWAELTGTTADGVLRDADLLGRLLETYVLCQLRPEIDVADRPLSAHHLRVENGRHEVDVVLDLGGDGVLALEIKATSAPDAADARHLGWFRDELGERFRGGVILCSAPRAFRLADRVWAAPISFLWDVEAMPPG